MCLREELAGVYGLALCAAAVEPLRAVFTTVYAGGIGHGELSEKLGLSPPGGYLWVELEGEGERVKKIRPGRIFFRIPVFRGGDRIGAVLLAGEETGTDRGGRMWSEQLLSEILSSILEPLLPGRRGEAMHSEEKLKFELLGSTGDEHRMREVLLETMERTQAEFCAFYTGAREGWLYIMLEGRELSPRITEIRDKLQKAFRMFTNMSEGDSRLNEKVYYKRQENDLSYLLGSFNLESYFIVPVTAGTMVRGVLLIGSVRREAFGRKDIGVFSSLAEEGRAGKGFPAAQAWDSGLVETVLDSIPMGCGLVSPDGRIVFANREFGSVLRIRGELPETVKEVSRASSYNLANVWEDFRTGGRKRQERELSGVGSGEGSVTVSWVRFEDLSMDISSAIFIEDTTARKEQEALRQGMVATVAHELRTPLTALRNSLRILFEGVSSGPAGKDETPGPELNPMARFMRTALRTADRLGLLVDSLVKVSSTRSLDPGFSIEPVPVGEFLEEASILFVNSMNIRGIDFDMRIENELSVLEMDRDRMEQVIQNLLSNSMKHVPAGGRISVSVERCDEPAEFVMPGIPWRYLQHHKFGDICIKDTGGGIPVEVAQRVNDSVGFPGVPGIMSGGLGLHIAKGLVRHHGGELVIEKAGRTGSEVHIYLPADAETGEIVRSFRRIERGLDLLSRRGIDPVLYSLVKENRMCWLEIAGNWEDVPAINTSPAEVIDNGVFMWPLGEGFAVALTAEERYRKDPVSLFRHGRGGLRLVQGDSMDGVRIGWAIVPVDGASFAELMTASLARTVTEKLFAR